MLVFQLDCEYKRNIALNKEYPFIFATKLNYIFICYIIPNIPAFIILLFFVESGNCFKNITVLT